MKTSIHEAENKLFASWAKKHKRFVPDGVVQESSFSSAPLRILFLLKEVNDPEGGDWDLRTTLIDNSLPQTWNNAARWVFGLLHAPPFPAFTSLPANIDQDFRNTWIQKIAVLNLKKTGGGSSAKPEDLLKFVRSDRDQIRQQLSLYDLDVTICGGTGWLLQHFLTADELGNWRQASNGTAFVSTQLLGLTIDYYHPQARFPSNFLYTVLMDAVKEARRSTERRT